MKMAELRTKAEDLGIKPGKMRKAFLIHTIQAAEGYEQCYGHSQGSCPYTDCGFRKACLKIRD